MTRFEALAITAPFFAVVVMGLLFLVITKFFDSRAAEKQNKQKQTEAARQTAGSALALSELPEAERMQVHIDTLEAFANAVRKASAAVEESSRVHGTTAAQRSLENEQR
jgi:hypothetical protein